MGKTSRRKHGKDRLSSLPDCLLVSILSLLPTKTAISTCVLSTRWKHLYTHLSHLSFTGPRSPKVSSCPHQSTSQMKLLYEQYTKFETFIKTVNHVLTHITSPKITKFELIMDMPWDYGMSDLEITPVDSWLRRVYSRHPEDFSVIPNITYTEFFTLRLPAAFVFQCDTIVSLQLGEGIIYDLPEEEEDGGLNFNLPNLKKLGIVIIEKQRNVKLLTTLFKNCPLLEELCLRTEFDREELVVEIVCPNLKTFDLKAWASNTIYEFVIDVPKLENLSISCSNAWFRFVNRPLELAKVKFEIWYEIKCDEEYGFFGKVSEAFKGISNVRSLDFDSYMVHDFHRGLEVLGHLEVFHNLSEFRIIDFDFTHAGGLMAFLRYCPNLEVLVLCIKHKFGNVYEYKFWEVPEFEPSWLLTKLRVLELKDLFGTKFHLEFIEYMVRNGSALEKLLVTNSDHNVQVHEFDFCQRLFSCQPISSDCEMKYCGRYITAGTKGGETWGL